MIYERAKENKEFSDTLNKVRENMEQTIVQNAINGKFNAAFATFYCKARLGMKENDTPQTQQVNIQVVTNGEQVPLIKVG
jgi:chromosome segregation ATPase